MELINIDMLRKNKAEGKVSGIDKAQIHENNAISLVLVQISKAFLDQHKGF